VFYLIFLFGQANSRRDDKRGRPVLAGRIRRVGAWDCGSMGRGGGDGGADCGLGLIRAGRGKREGGFARM